MNNNFNSIIFNFINACNSFNAINFYIAHAETTEIHDKIYLRNVSDILGVNEKNLTNALTKKCIFAKDEQVVNFDLFFLYLKLI